MEQSVVEAIHDQGAVDEPERVRGTNNMVVTAPILLAVDSGHCLCRRT